MKKQFLPVLFLVLAGVGLAQAPGTITVTGSVNVTAGVLTATGVPGASGGTVSITCAQGAQPPILTGTVTPPVSPVAGVQISCTVGNDSIAAIFQKSTTGVITWQAQANGVVKTGTF